MKQSYFLFLSFSLKVARGKEGVHSHFVSDAGKGSSGYNHDHISVAKSSDDMFLRVRTCAYVRGRACVRACVRACACGEYVRER